MNDRININEPHNYLSNCQCLNCATIRYNMTFTASPQQEMQSLVQIKAKLDAIAESQGKLLAALDEIGARTGDTLAMVNTIDFAVRKELNELDGRLKGLGDGLGSELGQMRKKQEELTALCIATWNYCIKHGVERPAKPKRKRTK